jgi:hypothetical protein
MQVHLLLYLQWSTSVITEIKMETDRVLTVFLVIMLTFSCFFAELQAKFDNALHQPGLCGPSVLEILASAEAVATFMLQ